MLFQVLPPRTQPPAASNRAFLVRDLWNDWYEYRTQFLLIVFDEQGARHEIGEVKIGQFDPPLIDEFKSPLLDDEFDALDPQFFSVGQSESYYEALAKLSQGKPILSALRDAAADNKIFEAAREEPIMQSSLLRHLDEQRVTGRFRRITRGDAELTPFEFAYLLLGGANQTSIELAFSVQPNSWPPTNIHVLIGKNGVGKTRTLNRMARALAEKDASPDQVGSFRSADEWSRLFANLVTVTFSAFDPFGPLRTPRQIGYSYIGLRSDEADSPGWPNSPAHVPQHTSPKSPDDLTEDFVRSVFRCRGLARRDRWRKSLESLQSDPLFGETEVTRLTEVDESDCEELAGSLFRDLSSGHKIVLLTISRLVETVDERSLVLLDEPEAHLHPPLLSAFIRTLSDLLIRRNGVAIIATHSPVVLQEVPRECVWILSRSGECVRADRPEVETFGENVGVLTSEVFGLEVSQSGFHKLLVEATDRTGSYDDTLDAFGGKLGAEARAIARALLARKARRDA